mgnify:CR=1 FL=1
MKGGFPMGKKSNIIHEAKKNLQKQCKYGQSKHAAKEKAREEAKRTGEKFKQVHGIYSTNTYDLYSSVCKSFIIHTLENHKEVRKFEDCRRYVRDFLQEKEDKGLSAWSLHAYASALACAYGCNKDDFGYDVPERSRKDIIRCRDFRSSDYRSPEEKWNDVKTIIRATGGRRAEISKYRKEDLREREDGNLEIFRRGKNKIQGWYPVLPQYKDFVKEYFDKAPTYTSANGEERIIRKEQIPSGSIHDLRASYACELYKYYEDRGDVASGKLYHCRKDMAGTSYDKGILAKVSEDLGHHRLDVVISYLYKLK